MSTPAPPSARTATIIHLALSAGMVMTVLVLSFLPGPADVAPEARRLLTYLLLALALGAFTAAQLLLTRLPAEPADTDAWWRARFGRALVGWALLEAGAVLGGVAYFLTREAYALGVPALGLVLLALAAPARLGPR